MKKVKTIRKININNIVILPEGKYIELADEVADCLISKARVVLTPTEEINNPHANHSDL